MLPLESTLANERYLSKKLCAVILLLGCVLDRGEISENSKRKINRCSSHVCTGYDDFFNTSRAGLTEEQVEENRDIYGENELTKGQEDSIFKKIYESIINPFTVILLLIALVSLVTNVWLAKPGQEDPTTFIIIVVLVLLSGSIRFVQELRSDKAASNLSRMIVNTVTIVREGKEQEIPITELVVGDIIRLSAGDMLPADVLILDSRDFFVQQSGLTGESDAVEKMALDKCETKETDSLLESEALAFMGTNVISGRAIALVLVVGDDTKMGAIEQTLNTYDEPTSFEREMNSISWLLIRLMLVLVPVVFFINGLTDGDWLEAGVFALSVGVGLTPEMLPMVITASLAKGSILMAKKKLSSRNSMPFKIWERLISFARIKQVH